MRYCPNCGKEIDDHAKFCVYCGARLEDVKSSEPAAKEDDLHFDWDDDDATKPLSPSDMSNDHWDDSVSKWDEEEESPEVTKKHVSVATLEKVKIALLIILIALVAVGGGFFYHSMSHTSTTNVSTSQTSEKSKKSSGSSKAKVSGEITGDQTSPSGSDSSDEDSQTETTPTYKTSTTSTGVTYVNRAVKNEAGGYYGHDDTSNAPTYESDNDVLPDSSRDKVTDSDLQDLTNSEIQTAINEIYARHGYKFSENTSFEDKSYYTGDKTESEAEAEMNSTEKYNIDYLADYKAHNK